MSKINNSVKNQRILKESKWLYQNGRITEAKPLLQELLKSLPSHPELLAIFADGDMICQTDIKELWDLKDDTKAVLVVKHNYQTKFQKKYLGNINENYPKKNWSSLILWNCGHPKHKILTPEYIAQQSGQFLHRFSWLNENDIGEIPIEWNWLAIEYPINPKAKIIHYTLGTACFRDFRETDMASEWLKTKERLLQGFD